MSSFNQNAIGAFSKFKRAFDKATPAELRKLDSKAKLPGWVIHDLRRTARSLMSRAGVLPKHAEMALGHAVAGVEGVYDRHRYLDEKRAHSKRWPSRSNASLISKQCHSDARR